MAFRILVCADVGGEKVNIELEFDRKPESVARIADVGEEVFRRAMRDKNLKAADFSVDFMVFYEDHTRRWKPLENVMQLTDFMQVYMFQHGGVSESVREIPAPTKREPVTATHERTVHRPGSGTQVDMDKIGTVFRDMDINDTGMIELQEMLHGFAAAGIDFNEETVKRLFEKSDANEDGHISWDEFIIFANLFPNTVETLYWRLRAVDLDSENRTASKELKLHRQKEHQLRKELKAAEQERKVLESRVRQEQNIARELDPRRRFLEEEEQDLINKEFALQFHRDMVVQAEMQFAETVVRFDHASMKQGSPRRARFLP